MASHRDRESRKRKVSGTSAEDITGSSDITSKFKLGSDLPATIDVEVAANAFRKQREALLELITQCLPSLSNSLYSEYLITKEVYDDVTKRSLTAREITANLLNCLEAKIKVVSGDFTKIVHVLESQPFLEPLAKKLVESYYHFSSATPAADQPEMSAAMADYALYLKKLYRSSPVCPINKWPPTPSKEYIQLSLVDGDSACTDNALNKILKGNIEEALAGRKSVSTDQILEPKEEQGRLKLVLIEGPPGIGKSTLAWELCRKWEELPCMKQYQLVIFLRLGEKKVQKISSISDLFFYRPSQDHKCLEKDFTSCHGKGVLFIMDGFDELPTALQREGFIVDLINRSILPESSVIVTSRPSATANLLSSCGVQKDKHVEILGFTQESVREYASSVFSSETELERFLAYISKSKNPAINSLMYIPINAAIVVLIFKESKSKCSMAHTSTGLYIQLCITLLNKHMISQDATEVITKFEDLPERQYNSFLELSKMAFECIKNEEVMLENNSVPSDFNHFGFLNSVESLCGGSRTYNFLHLTIQEFLAAYHISKLSDHGSTFFKECVENEHEFYNRWKTVWMFVAGITKFHFRDSIPFSNGLFANFFIECWFEAQIVIDIQSYTESNSSFWRSVRHLQNDSFHSFAKGYCVASSSSSHWDITCGQESGNELDFFVEGLLSGKTVCSGKIDILKVFGFTTSFRALKLSDSVSQTLHNRNPLTEILDLSCYYLLLNESFLKFHGYLQNLQKFDISNCSFDERYTSDQKITFWLKLMEQLQHTQIHSLDLSNTGIERLYSYSSSLFAKFRSLICPSSGVVRELHMGSQNPFIDIDSLMKAVSSPSSVQHLSLDYLGHSLMDLSPFSSFNPDNQLTSLELSFSTVTCQNQIIFMSNLVKDIIKILCHSNMLKHLYVSTEFGIQLMNWGVMSGLKQNTTLQTFVLRSNDGSSVSKIWSKPKNFRCDVQFSSLKRYSLFESKWKLQ